MADGTVVSKNEVHIVLAGKSGAGKSTIARNIFGMQTEIKLSPDSITEDYATEIIEERHGIKIHITDTPGLQQKGKKKELKKLSKHTKEETEKEVDLLVYCLSVDPSCKFADGNPAIMRSLQAAFGKEIWEHCVVIFTFSNRVLDWYEKNGEEAKRVTKYENFMKQYAAKFKGELEKMKVDNVDVEAVLNFQLEPTPEGQTVIPAIPAGDKAEDRVLPRFEVKTIDFEDRHDSGIKKRTTIANWRDVVFLEIAKKCNAEVQKSLLQYRYWGDRFEVLENTSGGIAAGAAGGAAIGAVIGFATGPIGLIAAPIISAIGAAIGAVVVGIAGGAAGGGIAAKTVLTG